MKSSLVLLVFLIFGICTGLLGLAPDPLINNNLELYVIYVLLILVGISIGCDTQAIDNIKRLNIQALLVPGFVAIGSLIGAGLMSYLFTGITLQEGLAVGAGFGWYSLASILINRIHGYELGAIALISNIFREVLTITLAPVLARFFGKLAPIACGGATTMDTTLPLIYRVVGAKYAIIALINGIVLSILVPILIPILLSLN